MDRRTVIRWLGLGVAAAASGEAVWLLTRQPTHTPDAPSELVGGSPTPSNASPSAPSRGAPVADDVLRARTVAPPQPPPSTTVRPADVVPLVCREAWDARAPSRAFDEHRIVRLTVHHTAVPLDDRTSGPARARGHQRHHQEQGFADLAYHHLIDRTGTVYAARPVGAPGETFTDYDPHGHYLPCLEGDFDRHDPSPEQLDALITMLAWAARTYDVDPATIAGHDAYAATACPGRAVRELLAAGEIQRGVERRLATGAPAFTERCGSAGRAHVRAVEQGQV